ncbi:hypothetical protein SAMN05660653_03185 [Desulfonatronum thiosulfatophilum]|uniref:Uncharacterized protein n=1 Tax=Desulfonatronum thiosulfatophilum TaxID=617002 RepID=A0A1G6EUX1_9BACT|nr:hypothetical protein [Desulfonatronum thiosulfatophilum]SDB61270.1 hypothetical protein SAMN05660653_03185 [Desulfonatronum thiosulfatophilum]
MRKALLVVIGGILILVAGMVILWEPADQPPPEIVQPPSAPPEPDLAPPFQLQPPPPFPVEPEPEESEPTDILPEDMEGVPDETEPEPIGFTNITMGFFDDLAEQIVTGYLPPGSELNPDSTGRLRIHFSALNRRYGMALVGLEHQSPSLLEGREEIFSNLLQPEAIENLWMIFHPFFEQALDEALRSATWAFPAPNDAFEQRELTASEQQDFYRLASAAVSALAHAVQLYSLHDESIPLTEQWLLGQTSAFAAHSRYQQAEAELERAQQEAPEDQVRILDERLERDAAAQGIMRAIAVRENARQELLAVFLSATPRPDLTEGELLYLSEWLWRRLHNHPPRVEVFMLLADKLHEMALRLQPDN